MTSVQQNNEGTDSTNETVNSSVEQGEQEFEGGRKRYEVVFFVKYNMTFERPSEENIVSYFTKYGDVDHVNCPENKNYAIVFMESLNTEVEHRRTRTTISQIIKDMTPETKFYITVASSGARQFNRNYYQGGSSRSYHHGYEYDFYPRTSINHRYYGLPVYSEQDRFYAPRRYNQYRQYRQYGQYNRFDQYADHRMPFQQRTVNQAGQQSQYQRHQSTHPLETRSVNGRTRSQFNGQRQYRQRSRSIPKYSNQTMNQARNQMVSPVRSPVAKQE